MIYCTSCSSLLNEDVRFCPHCNNEDPDFEDFNSDESLAEKLRQANRQVAENELANKAVFNLAETFAETPIATPVKTPIEDSIKETFPTKEPIPGISNKNEAQVKTPTGDKPSDALFVGMMLLSIFVSIVGIVFAIVFVMNKSKHYQTMGIIMLVISVFGLFAGGTLLCCVFGIIFEGW